MGEHYGKLGAGILYICSEDDSCLLLFRSKNVHEPFTWGISGGKLDKEESLFDCAKRETAEELFQGDLGKLPTDYEIIRDITYSDEDFKYTTFILDIKTVENKNNLTKSIKLNWENTKFNWFPYSALPSKLHFGLNYIRDSVKEDPHFLEMDDPKNEFDWIIPEFSKIIRKTTVPQDLKERVDIFAECIITIKKFTKSKETYSDHIDDLKLMSDNIITKINEIIRIYKDNNQSELINDLENIKAKLLHDKKYHDKVELGKINKYFYHGTDFKSALSIFKSKTFYDNRYNRLSLSTDVNSAAGFGDVIFAFIADKVIEKYNAKPIKYVEDLTTNEDNDESATINEMYKYEQEWFIKPLPFKYDDDDLSHIIYISTFSSKDVANRIKSLLEIHSQKPVALKNIQSFSHTTTKSSNITDGLLNADHSALDFNNNVAQAISQFNRCKQALNNIRYSYTLNNILDMLNNMLHDDHDHMIDYSGLYREINNFKKNLSQDQKEKITDIIDLGVKYINKSEDILSDKFIKLNNDTNSTLTHELKRYYKNYPFICKLIKHDISQFEKLILTDPQILNVFNLTYIFQSIDLTSFSIDFLCKFPKEILDLPLNILEKFESIITTILKTNSKVSKQFIESQLSYSYQSSSLFDKISYLINLYNKSNSDKITDNDSEQKYINHRSAELSEFTVNDLDMMGEDLWKNAMLKEPHLTLKNILHMINETKGSKAEKVWTYLLNLRKKLQLDS